MDMLPWDVFLCVLYGLVAVAIVFSNCFCLVVIRAVRTINKPTKLLMASLSVADLCQGVFVVLPVVAALVTGGRPNQNVIWCSFSAFCTIFFPVAGIACIMLLNVDRFVAIFRPLHYHEIVTVRRAYLAVGAAWLLSLVMTCLLGFLPGRCVVYHPQFHMCFFTSSRPDGGSFLLSVCLLVVNVAVPILASTVFYVFIVRIARRHTKMMITFSTGDGHTVDMSTLSGQGDSTTGKDRALTPTTTTNNNNTTTQTRKPNTKAANTFFIVTAGFVVTWLPFLAILLHEGLKNNIVPRGLADISQVAVFSCSWWNILIFYIRNSGFNKKARELLRLRH